MTNQPRIPVTNKGPSLKLTIRTWKKNDAWNTFSFPFGKVLFHGRQPVSFREGNYPGHGVAFLTATSAAASIGSIRCQVVQFLSAISPFLSVTWVAFCHEEMRKRPNPPKSYVTKY